MRPNRSGIKSGGFVTSVAVNRIFKTFLKYDDFYSAHILINIEFRLNQSFASKSCPEP